MPSLLATRGLTKRFPGVVALREVSFELEAGEIHALCGENGAGKSTLIKLLGGIHPHGTYEGELRIDGRLAAFRGVRDAEEAGIAVITQEFALVEELSVAENLFLGRAPRRGWRIDWAEMHRAARGGLPAADVAAEAERHLAGAEALMQRALDYKPSFLDGLLGKSAIAQTRAKLAAGYLLEPVK